jgi:hypothetical protein
MKDYLELTPENAPVTYSVAVAHGGVDYLGLLDVWHDLFHGREPWKKKSADPFWDIRVQNYFLPVLMADGLVRQTGSAFELVKPVETIMFVGADAHATRAHFAKCAATAAGVIAADAVQNPDLTAWGSATVVVEAEDEFCRNIIHGVKTQMIRANECVSHVAPEKKRKLSISLTYNLADLKE